MRTVIRSRLARIETKLGLGNKPISFRWGLPPEGPEDPNICWLRWIGERDFFQNGPLERINFEPGEKEQMMKARRMRPGKDSLTLPVLESKIARIQDELKREGVSDSELKNFLAKEQEPPAAPKVEPEELRADELNLLVKRRGR